MNRLFILALVISISFKLQGQDQPNDSILNKKRMTALVISGTALYTGTMIGLGTIWYEDFSHFRFFNDNDQWGLMDKMGHLTSAQHLSRYGTDIIKWTGLEERKAIWSASITGFILLSSIEVFDGFQEEWGFSIGDMTANALGSGLYLSQQLTWGEQRILTKWSYQPSTYAQYRPELLGSNATERWLKDYNGQTYWVSFNLKSLLFQKNESIPAWLNVAVGYGIEGYTGGDSNPPENSRGETIPPFERYGQVYFGPDIDLVKIPVQSRFLRGTLRALNFVKFPLPGMSYSQVDGWRFHWMAF
jgi:hypothetical protein